MRRLKMDMKFKVYFLTYERHLIRFGMKVSSLNGISRKLLCLVKDLLSDRKQRVVLNGKCLSWMDVHAGIPRGSIIGPLLLLIQVNDIPDNLVSNAKLLADDRSLFSTVTDPNITANQINNDLHNISAWAYQWKMNFNPDTSKQAQELIFSRKVRVTAPPRFVFNNNPVHQTAT